MAILINDTAPRNQYTASSGQTVFTVSFEFFENADLKVYKNGILQTITTHYTVTGAGVTGGGSITLTSGATTGDIITIIRDIPVKRVTDFPTSGPFNISALNTELDKIIAMVQEREDDIARVVQLSDSDTSTSLILPVAASRASKVLGFDATGNAIVMQELGNYRGNWASGTAYVLRDLVKDTSNANIYICVQAHTSSGSQPLSTNPNAASWALLVDAATAASASASASASATSASGSASSAATFSSNALSSSINAANSASAASTSATNAANSASAASTSATNAANSATSASGSASTASTQASNASTSATNAAASASAAATSASNASTSAGNAAASASLSAASSANASVYATNAANAQAAAESARDATLAAYDNFDDRYLGEKTSNPSLDNDGDALVGGALYFNSVAGEMRLWTGSAWVAAYVSGAGFLSTSGGTITGDLIVNSTGATTGVLINQTGTGNALVVEDSANPDATPFVVNASGNVGIGTSSPGALLDIDGGSIRIANGREVNFRNAAGTGVAQFKLQTDDNFVVYNAATIPIQVFTQSATPSASYQADSNNLMNINASTGVITWRTAGAERMRIDSSGNVGIGTSAPGSKLDVKGTLRLSGSTSGYVGFAPAAAAGSTTYTLPTTDGTSGQVLSTDGSGVLSWSTRVGLNDTQTLTNKRINPRVISITGAAGGNITPTGDTADQYIVTALGAAATLLAPSGTPVDGQKLTLRIKDNGTARALTWTTTSGAYRVIGTTLPTTTVINKTIYVGCIYNSADTFWDVIAVASEV